MSPDFLRYIPEEDTETSYNKKRLPGYDHNAYNSSPAGRRVGNVVASKVEVYCQDQKGHNQHVKKCRIGFHWVWIAPLKTPNCTFLVCKMRLEGSKFLTQQLGSDHTDSWDHCVKHKGMELYGYYVIPSHVHMVLGTHGENMEEIMRDMKRHTSNSIEIRNSKVFF